MRLVHTLSQINLFSLPSSLFIIFNFIFPLTLKFPVYIQMFCKRKLSNTNCNKIFSVRFNVTLRSFHVANVGMENQYLFHILSVCL